MSRMKPYLFPAFVIMLFMLAFSPYHALLNSQLKADDASYLSHAFTLGLDFNFAYENAIANWFAPSGIPAHPMGAGLLAAPFVAIFSLADRVLDLPVIADHQQYLYSWSLFGFVFACAFYFIFGIHLFRRGLESLKLKLNQQLLILFSCSFGLLYYILFRPMMSHAFEFFTLSLCFWASTRIAEFELDKKRTAPWFLFCLLAFGIALTIEVRPANLNVFLLPIIIFITKKMLINEIDVRQKIKGLMFRFVLTLMIVFLPFWLMHSQVYGTWMPSNQDLYGMSTWNPVPQIRNGQDLIAVLTTLITRLPHVLTILFSSEFGLLYTSPILLMGPLCFIYWLASHQNKRLLVVNLVLILAYCGLPVAIILFWQSPADAYAYRFMFCLFPIAILGFAVFNEYVASQLIKKVLVVLSVLALVANLFFGLSPQLMYQPGINAFGVYWGSARGYNTTVLKASISLNTWISLVGTRFPGFIAIGMIKNWDVQVEKVPPALQEKWHKVNCCYQFPPGRVYLQSGLLALLFIGGLLLIARDPSRLHSKNNQKNQ